MPKKEPQIKPAKIFSDEPVRNSDDGGFFYFPQYANTISDIIAFKENKTPLTIGIYGSWGTGKTSLMRLIEDKLKKYENKGDFRKCKTVWLQAWKYADEDKILAALIEEIFKAMGDGDISQNMNAQLEKVTKSLSTRKVISMLSKLITKGDFDITEALDKQPHMDKLSFVNTFDKFFDDLIYTYVFGSKTTDSDKFDDEKGVMVIFIDDLDRCPKERIPKVLGAIKLFLDKPGCVFVIGADMDIIKEGLKEAYPTGADRFMEKIVQLSFNLPKMDDTSGKDFLKDMNDDETLQKIAPLLINSLEHNPRRIKRLINDYNFMNSLAENRYAGNENPIESDPLLRWLIILNFYSGFARLMRLNPDYVRTAQEQIETLEEKLNENEKNNWIIEEKLKEIDPSMVLEKFLKDKNFVSLIKDFPAEKEKIEPYISFTTSVVVVEEKEETPDEEAGGFDKFTKAISGGKFKVEELDKEIEIEKDYQMGIYPVTNSQYERFIEAGGYRNKEYWPDEGRKWREKEGIMQPKYWDDKKWNQADYPVVGVSWYEAEAYCIWLNQKTGENYRLPAEAEWEKAASWDEEKKTKSVYPWGDEFDKEKCNSSESGIGRTTPVNKYPQGLSPYGCYDMAGNVWEWCAGWYTEGESRVLRGGSWRSAQQYARCVYRYYSHPSYRRHILGFRLSRTKTITPSS